MKKVLKRKFPYGVCDCNTGLSGGCCKGFGPAAFEVVRDGKKMRLCTRCDLPSDQKKLLVKKSDNASIWMDFDALGGFCIIGMLAKD